MQRFTSVFGMGTGGSTALWTPGKLVSHQIIRICQLRSECDQVHCICVISAKAVLALYGQASRVISTS